MRNWLAGLCLMAVPTPSATAGQTADKPAAATAAWDPTPWLADVAQMRAALEEKYANLEWLRDERDLPLDRPFARLEAEVKRAGGDAAARAAFDRLIRRIVDGHVDLRWPAPPASKTDDRAEAGGSPDKARFCAALGYDARQVRPGTAASLPGYRPVGPEPFAHGVVPSGGTSVGVVRIGVFDPHGYPSLCEAAVEAERLPVDKPCDERCADAVITHAYAALTRRLEEAYARLKAEGATTLIVDVSDNGGGSEWAEAAARTLSARTLTSARTGFVRGAHWTRIWGDLAGNLRRFAAKSGRADRTRLLAWAAQAEGAKREASTPCTPGADCARIVPFGYATGLVGDAGPGAFAGKPWGAYVFNPAQFPYAQGAWDGPVIVLTDDETWSAAEQFAAMLQDNRVAVVMGGRTGGAGCGHSWGGTPTTLTHSRAVLRVPDCVRFRADGSNEVRGVIPDVATGVRANDGAKLRAALTAAKLGEAVDRAGELHRMPK